MESIRDVRIVNEYKNMRKRFIKSIKVAKR
jgi:hypothetical protein